MRPAGLLRVAALALIWGSGFLWIKISLRGFTPVQLTWARLALGAAVLLAVVLATGKRLPTGGRIWGHLTIAALLGNAIPYTLFGVAEQHVTSALAGAINATTPLWTLLLGLLFRVDRQMTAARMTGLVLGLIGALLILAPWQSMNGAQLTGAILCLVASASYGASYVYIGRYLSDTGLSSIVLSVSQLTAATGLLTITLPTGPLTPTAWRADATTALMILGLIGTGAAYVLNYRIISDDGPLIASTVAYLLPVVAVVLGGLLLEENLVLRQIVGVAVVLLGVGLIRQKSGGGQGPTQPKTPRGWKRLSNQALEGRD